MRALDFVVPASVEEALDLLHQHGSDAKPMAGGTSLVLLMNQRLAEPACLVSLQRLWTLAEVSGNEGGLHIGPLITHREIETSDVIRRHAPLLCDTVRQVATVRIRNQATIGGNLAQADPALDPPASLIALDATVRLVSERGQRTVPLDEFFVGYYETVLEPDELIDDVFIPFQPPRTAGVYIKYLPRTADDYGTVGVAARLTLEDDLEHVSDARIVLTSVGPTAVCARDAEEALRGQFADRSTFEDAASLATRDLSPVSDSRGSAAYKRDMSAIFVRRALERVLQDARGISDDDQ